MARIIAITNQKGGVGKTTTSVNLAASLAAVGYKTLLIDFDPQKNATVSVAIPPKSLNSYTFLVGNSSFEESIFETFIPNLWVMPSTTNLAAAEVELAHAPRRGYILKDRLSTFTKKFDFILIDCPPSFGLLSLNALSVAQFVLVPLQCEYYALEGLVFLLDNILKVKKTFNPALSVCGILLTMYDKRSILSTQIEKDVRNNLGEKVFHTVIPRNIRIAEAPSHGKPILFYDIKCAGSLAYLELTKEFLERVNHTQHNTQKENTHAK